MLIPEVALSSYTGILAWQRGVAVTSLGVSTKLLYVGPG